MGVAINDLKAQKNNELPSEEQLQRELSELRERKRQESIKKTHKNEEMKLDEKDTIPLPAANDVQRTEPLGEGDDVITLMDSSLFLLKPNNRLRKICHSLTTNPWFDRFILLNILANCICLAMVDPTGLKEQPELRNADIYFTILFTLELLTRIFAKGAFFSSRNFKVRRKYGPSYLSDPWSWIDLIVVATAWPPLFVEVASMSAFRAFRVLRPLRTLNVVPFMRLIVTSLFASIPLLLDVTFQSVFVMSLFSILGSNLFSGKFHQYCTNGPDPYTSDAFPDGILCGSVKCNVEAPNVQPELVCSWNGTTGEFFEAPEFGFVNFDNFLMSMLTVFTCATMEGWTDVMYTAMDVAGIWSFIYFVVVIFVIGFLVFNLTLAVIADTFQNVNVLDIAEANEEFNRKMRMREDANRTFRARSIVFFRQCYAETANRMEWFTPVQKFFLKAVRSPIFELMINLVVIINITIMAATYYQMPAGLFQAFEIMNTFFTYVFVVEMIVKIIALGPIGYFTDLVNVLDAFITVIAFVEIILGSGSISTFRILRLLKLIKVFQSLRDLQLLLLKVLSSFFAVLKFFPVLLLCMFIFTILGMQFYGASYTTTEPTEKFPKVGEICTGTAKSDTGCPRSNFSTFWNAFLLVFQMLTGENWNSAMYDAMFYTTPWSSLFFVIMFVVLNFVMLNIFLTIMLLRFAEPDDEFETDAARANGDKISLRESLKNASKYLGRLLTCRLKRRSALSDSIILDFVDEDSDCFHSARDSFSVDTEPKSQEGAHAAQKATRLQKMLHGESPSTHAMEFTSLWVLSPQNGFRKLCYKVISSKSFEWGIFAVIVGNSICLALQSPQWPADSPVRDALYILDFIWLGVFTIEAIVKTSALGFALHPGAYLRDPWNILDFTIVVTGYLDILPLNLGFLRSFRALRALRPLRMVKRLEGLRVVFYSLIQALPRCGNVLIVAFLVWFLFAVIGVNFFAGKFYACQCDFVPYGTDTPLIGESVDLVRSVLPMEEVRQSFGSTCSSEFVAQLQTQENARTLCEEAGGSWVSFPANFDNILIALLTLFEVSTLENWLDVMYAAMDAVGPDREPVEDYNEVASLYFIFFIFIGSFFTLNLFVSVIVDAFTSIKRQAEYGSSALLTRAQFEWLEDQRMVLRMNVHRQALPPVPGGFLSTIRQFAFRFTQSTVFEWFITGSILLNTVVLALEYWNMPYSLKGFLFTANLVFTGIFMFEATVKILGLGAKQYFSDGWNIFDFSIVALSVVPLIIDLYLLIDPEASIFNTNFIRVFRLFRMLRVLRLVKRLKNIRILFQALILSLPSIANVGTMLFLIFFVYSVLGVQLFGRIGILPYPAPNGGGIQKYANFWNCGWAMLTLLRCSTGEAWNSIMWDLLVQGGAYSWSWIYFVSFVILGSFVVLNLFIAIVLEAFATVMEYDKFRVTQDHLDQFAYVWARFDPNGDKQIEIVRDLKPLLRELKPPLGLGQHATTADILYFIEELRLPDGTRMKMARGGYVGFHELLASLVCRAYQVDVENLPVGLQDRVKKGSEALKKKQVRSSRSQESEFEAMAHARNHFAATTLQIIARRYMERVEKHPSEHREVQEIYGHHDQASKEKMEPHSQQEQNGLYSHQEQNGYSHQEQNGSYSHQEPNGSYSHQEQNVSSSHQEQNGSSSHQEQNGSSSHQEQNGSSSHQEQNGSSSQQEQNGSSSHQEQNGSYPHREQNRRHLYHQQNEHHGLHPTNGGTESLAHAITGWMPYGFRGDRDAPAETFVIRSREESDDLNSDISDKLHDRRDDRDEI